MILTEDGLMHSLYPLNNWVDDVMAGVRGLRTATVVDDYVAQRLSLSQKPSAVCHLFFSFFKRVDKAGHKCHKNGTPNFQRN